VEVEGQVEPDKMVMEGVKANVAEHLIVLHGHQSALNGDIARKITLLVTQMRASVVHKLIVLTGHPFVVNGVTVKRVEVVAMGVEEIVVVDVEKEAVEG